MEELFMHIHILVALIIVILIILFCVTSHLNYKYKSELEKKLNEVKDWQLLIVSNADKNKEELWKEIVILQSKISTLTDMIKNPEKYKKQ